MSGLTWATSAYAADSFADAQAACGVLATGGYGGLTDWRVPTFRELSRIFSREELGVVGGTWPDDMEFAADAAWWSADASKSDPTRMIGVVGNWPWTEPLPASGGAGTFQGSRYTYCVSGPTMAGAWVVNDDAMMLTGTPNRVSPGFLEIAWVRETDGTTRQGNVGGLAGGARCVRGPA